MNTMNMPGFAAEASLYRSDPHYRMNTMLASLRQGGTGIVQPALAAFGARCFNSMKGRLCCAWAYGAASCCDSEGSCETFRI